MKRRLISILLAISMAITLLPEMAWAADAEAPLSGTLYDLQWKIEPKSANEKILTISGTGDMHVMTNGTNYLYPWRYHYDSLTSVVIDNGVTSIAEGSFAGATNLIEVTISSSVVSIANYAFRECSSLERVTIAGENTALGDSAFIGCSSLTSIGPIGSDCNIQFYWSGTSSIFNLSAIRCLNIQKLIIPEGVTDIVYPLRASSFQLTNIIIPSSVTYVGVNEYQYIQNGSPSLFSEMAGLESAGPIGGSYSIQFGWNDEIPDCAFADSGISRAVLPNGITRIGNYSFHHCKNLTQISIPDSVASIGDGAFAGCENLSSIVIPNAVTTIGISAFQKCTKLTSITVPNSITSLGESAFKDCSELKNVVIPTSVKYFSPSVFQNCTNLSYVVIPNSINIIPLNAFAGCSNLTDVYYSGTPGEWLSVSISEGNDALKNATIHYNSTGPDDIKKETISGTLRSGDGWKILWKCSYELTNDNTPCNGTVDIYMDGFSEKIEELYIYNDSSADGFPWELEPYNIPKSAITKLFVRGQAVGKSLRITANAFQNYNNLETVVLDDVSGIDSYAFEGCISLKKVLIQETDEDLTRIGKGAFLNCTSLEEMPFPNGLVYIGDEAFKNAALGNVSIYGGVTSIGKDTFSDCTKLKIYCYKDTVVHQYAVENNIPFELITEPTDNTFIFGQDQWNFINSAKYFTDGGTEKYFLTSNDYNALTANLSNTEKEIIDDAINRDWGGSCYGMSVAAILAKVGAITPSSIQAGRDSIFSITKSNNDKVESFINFYHFQQYLQPIVNCTKNFMKRSTSDQLKEIERKSGYVSRSGVPVQFSFTGGGGGHAIVAYGVEHGEFIWEGKKYDSRILTYDCNYPGGSERSYLWYNTGTDEWCIPNYPWAEKLKRANNVIDILDCVNRRTTVENYTTRLDFDGEANGYFIEYGGSQLFIDSSTDMREEGLITYYDANVTADGIGRSETLHLILPDSTSSYSIIPSKDGTINDFTLFYEDSALSMACGAADNITFNPEGKIDATGVSGQYSADLVFNDGYHSLPWYKISISGTSCGDISLSQVDTGIIIDGDNLKDVVVIVKDDNETRNLQFSTEEESVLLTSKSFSDGTKPVIMLDSNDDGIYDKVIEDSSVPSNPGTTTPSTPGYTPGSTYTPTIYSITMPSVIGGKVNVNPASAPSGSTVIIMATSDVGYELVSLAVVDSKGDALKLTDNGDGKYTFIMPSGKVTINAVFDKLWVNPFADISQGAWYYDAVKFVNEKGLMNGVGNGLFAPNSNLLRAEFAQILYNKESRPVANSGNIFADVEAGQWYTDAIAWAAGHGIISGYGNRLFGPGNSITREQLAVMLWRYAGEPAAASKELHFNDADEVSLYALDALYWAAENGIIHGKGNGILDPQGTATRAEVAQMLMNYLKR